MRGGVSTAEVGAAAAAVCVCGRKLASGLSAASLSRRPHWLARGVCWTFTPEMAPLARVSAGTGSAASARGPGPIRGCDSPTRRLALPARLRLRLSPGLLITMMAGVAELAAAAALCQCSPGSFASLSVASAGGQASCIACPQAPYTVSSVPDAVSCLPMCPVPGQLALGCVTVPVRQLELVQVVLPR
jgi:hypothetical protein